MYERRDLRDCDFKGLFNPSGCVNCDLIKKVKQVIPPYELNAEPVEEYHLFDKLKNLK